MASARRQHYVCTWSATSGEGRRKPSDTSKAEFRDMFQSAVQSVSAKHYSSSLGIEKAAFVEEQHEPPPDDEVEHSADDLRHFHAAVSFNKLILIKRLAAELRERFSIHAHFSLTHSYWWSCIRYVTQPSEKKPSSEIDKEPLLIGISKDSLFRESQRSFNTKRSYEQNRVRARFQADLEKVVLFLSPESFYLQASEIPHPWHIYAIGYRQAVAFLKPGNIGPDPDSAAMLAQISLSANSFQVIKMLFPRGAGSNRGADIRSMRSTKKQ